MASSRLVEEATPVRSAVRARSYLFVPADRPDRIGKALTAGADAVIVDLEDAVAPAVKDDARRALAANLHADRPVIVRINAADTSWYAEDVRLCRLPGVSAVMLPKAASSDDVSDLASHLNGLPILPLIETARGVWNALAIAQAAGVQRLAFGPLDLQLDLGMQDGDQELAWHRAQLVLASRVAGILSPVDGPTTAIDDIEAIRSDAARARRTGFGGKLCIHPKQVPAVNECFSPSAAEVAWATRVVAAVQSAGAGAVAVDGKMVDRPVLARAEAILEQHACVGVPSEHDR